MAVTTPKFPPPPRNAQNSSSSLSWFGDNDASVRENDLCGEEIVERKPEAADQRPIAAAQCQSGHADGAARACHGRDAERIGHGEQHLTRGRLPKFARYDCREPTTTPFMPLRSMTIPSHRARPAQSWPPPRTDSGRSTVARGSNCRLDVFGRPAVDDSARHAADRLCPDRRCGSVAVVARPRETAGQLLTKSVECSFDQIGHFLLPWSGGTFSAPPTAIWKTLRIAGNRSTDGKMAVDNVRSSVVRTFAPRIIPAPGRGARRHTQTQRKIEDAKPKI